MRPIQNGVGIQAGISITTFGVTAALDVAPEFGVILKDLKTDTMKSHAKRLCMLFARRGSFEMF
jgi:hypothetical protein